jgi:histone H2A
VTIAQGGVLPNIHSVLLPKASEEPKGKGGKKQSGSASQAF